MKNQQPAVNAKLYSPRATVCAIGIKLRSLKFFDTIAGQVKDGDRVVISAGKQGLTFNGKLAAAA